MPLADDAAPAAVSPARRKGLFPNFRRFFGRGLAILLPSMLTLWILWQVFAFVFNNVGRPINTAVRTVVIALYEELPEDGGKPAWYIVTNEQIENAQSERSRRGLPVLERAATERMLRREQFRGFWDENIALELTGLLVAIVLIYICGLLLSNFLGRRLYLAAEQLISRIPGFKQIYPHVKQLVDLVMGEQKMAFNKVVLVEYPRTGIWTLGFLTGSAFGAVHSRAGVKVKTVFIPTSPTPFTGFTINLPADEVHEVDMPIDQALRFVITAGVLAPDERGLPRGTGVGAAAGGRTAVPAGVPGAGSGQVSAPVPGHPRSGAGGVGQRGVNEGDSGSSSGDPSGAGGGGYDRT